MKKNLLRDFAIIITAMAFIFIVAGWVDSAHAGSRCHYVNGNYTCFTDPSPTRPQGGTTNCSVVGGVISCF